VARRRKRKGIGRAALALLAIPALYLLAALAGSLIPVNRNWEEPSRGTTVYLRSNGIHVDIVMPAVAEGLDWRSLFPRSHFRDAPASPRWFSFGAGERRVYLETPTWWDISPRTLWAALAGGQRVMHVDRLERPGPDLRAIRLRPEEYRRLWAAVRAQFDLTAGGRPQRIDHPGYGSDDAFYRGRGKASAVSTCNSWVAEQLRLAGVKGSLWSPFAEGLTWRYRKVDAQPG
jgi:uncharacterized protein (TIGR02117 family)